MRLLILTQIIDTEDPMLGFMHTWVEEFSKNFEKITVVCLKVGNHNLPKNVQVFSLGKPARGGPASGGERMLSRLRYATNFFSYVWKYRREYDSVYVHMNQEYVLLGGWLWRLMGKKVTMWRNHHAGTFLTDIASLFCNKIFCTSKFSYTAKYNKTVFMPVGVPTDMFRPLPNTKRVPHSILSFVRISPAKKIEQLVDALDIINKKGVPFTATICGDAIPEHKAYENSLHTQVEKLGLRDKVSFTHGIPFDKAPELYASHDISVNQSPSGMFDKTIFEAMLCETLALSCNENLRGMIDEVFLFKEDDVSDLAQKLEVLLALSNEERAQKTTPLREFARDTHSLGYLAVRLKEELL